MGTWEDFEKDLKNYGHKLNGKLFISLIQSPVLNFSCLLLFMLFKMLYLIVRLFSPIIVRVVIKWAMKIFHIRA